MSKPTTAVPSADERGINCRQISSAKRGRSHIDVVRQVRQTPMHVAHSRQQRRGQVVVALVPAVHLRGGGLRVIALLDRPFQTPAEVGAARGNCNQGCWSTAV